MGPAADPDLQFEPIEDAACTVILRLMQTSGFLFPKHQILGTSEKTS